MKKVFILLISTILVVFSGLSFFVFRNISIVNNNSKSSIDVLWISANFFQKTDKLYLDLDHNGNFLSKKEVQGKTEVRLGVLSQDIMGKVFKVGGARGVLDARDTRTGESLFSQSEWVKVSVLTDGKIKSSQSVPIEEFSSDFQQLLKELKQLAEKQPLTENIKAFLVAETVDPQRVQSIKSDPRRFFGFVTFNEDDLSVAPTIKNAIGALGRQISVQNDLELQNIEKYIKMSNLKSINKDFFMVFANNSYQLHLLPVK